MPLLVFASTFCLPVIVFFVITTRVRYGGIMNLKALFAAAVTTIALVSCGTSTGGGVKADKTSTTKSMAKIQKAFNSLNFFSAPLRQQAGTPEAYSCSNGGTMNVTVTETEAGGSFSLSSTGCIEGDVNFTSVNFSMDFTVSGGASDLSINLTMNGSISFTSSEVSDTLAFDDFSMTITTNESGTDYTVTLNGSVTADGDTVVFNNDTYSSSDFGS
jgi:hypothetical protein